MKQDNKPYTEYKPYEFNDESNLTFVTTQKKIHTMETNTEIVAREYATIKGKGEFGLVFSAFKQGANWQKEQDKEENESLRAINDELLEALKFIVNDIPFYGEDPILSVKGYNKACSAIEKATK